MIRAGETVLARVDRIFASKAELTILSGESGEVFEFPIRGSVRMQDARSFDIDKAPIGDHFAPGDIVRAAVLSAGDMKSCFLSTAAQGLGVVVAKDDAGQLLLPVDQSHMRNPQGVVFKRKVAKPDYLCPGQ